MKLDRKAGVGQLDCRICGQKFQCAVNYLSAAVDVYGEWVDAADAVAKADTTNNGYESLAKAPLGRSLKRVHTGRNTTTDDEGYGGEGVPADEEDDFQ